MRCDDADDARVAWASYISHHHVPNNALELGMGGVIQKRGYGRTMRIYIHTPSWPSCERKQDDNTSASIHVQAIYFMIVTK